ncbi:MAG: NADH-quinone oxidoreductase subunit C [Candidatus Omnitrophica bacterium]|nr:NADH-quinone oxidoreductase subunit C [Candidatus Omnitrophota bacterium]
MEDIISHIRDKLKDSIIKVEEKATPRVYIEFKPENIPEAAEFVFKELGCRMITASGIDTPQGIEILYHFSQDVSGKVISLRTLITNKKSPEIDSIAHIIKGAEWIEREIWELLGVNFKGHPDLRHLLLIDDWPEGKHPLRKDNR